MSEKIERKKIEDERLLAEENRRKTEENIKEELKTIFSTGVIFGFKIGDNNMESLSKLMVNKTVENNYHGKYYMKCDQNQCKDLFKDAALQAALKSVEFSFCVPDAQEFKGKQHFKMTGFKIEFFDYQQATSYKEYLDLNKTILNPPAKVIQKFERFINGIELNWSKDLKTRDYNYYVTDICDNWRGVFGGRPHKY